MLNQQDMTEISRDALNEFTATEWMQSDRVAYLMGISKAKCQLILTQLAMAGLLEEGLNGEIFRRSQQAA